jgi:hypothetical protein
MTEKINKESNLLIRLTSEEKKLLQYEAISQGVTMAQLVRNLTTLPFKQKKDVELYYNILKRVIQKDENPTKLNDHLLYQILSNDEDNKFSIIKHYGLTNNEVKLIVKEWYLSLEQTIQDEYGNDLEEIVELEF